MNTKIKKIAARQVLDCKARPMLEVDVYTEDGDMGRGSAPTGTSVGMYEAYVLRDGDQNEYNGLSVHKAEAAVRDVIAPALLGLDVRDQQTIDETMIALDGTADKRTLGGNSIYSVSVACFRAAAAAAKQPVYAYLAGETLQSIPLPCFNIMNGGKNGGVVQAFNEFMLAPVGAKSVEEAIEMAVLVYDRLGGVVSRYLKGEKPLIGGSYGYAAPSDDPAVALSLMAEAVEECGYTEKMAYALDCASSEMYDAKTNTYELKGKRVSAEDIIACVKKLSEDFRLLFVEDILDENDWDGFAKARRELSRTNLIGDDLTVTNLEKLRKAREMSAIDGFILKPNQVGTLTEAFRAGDYAKEQGWLVIPSGRSGGAVGDIVGELSLGLHTAVSKNGAPRSGERLDKMNMLLRAKSETGAPLHSLQGILKF